MNLNRLPIVFFSSLAVFITFISRSDAQSVPTIDQALSLVKNASYKDAYVLFREISISNDERFTSRDRATAIRQGAVCLNYLGRMEEIDRFLEEAVRAHPRDWRVLAAAARVYRDTQHFGQIVAGEFVRGFGSPGGRHVSSFKRDRVRALQLYHGALEIAEREAGGVEVAEAYKQFACTLKPSNKCGSATNHGTNVWELQHLTDVSTLPDYTEDSPRFGGHGRTPSTPDGMPIYFTLPTSFEGAKNDGERWRWALSMVVKKNPLRREEVELELARFYESLYGERTLSTIIHPRQGDGETSRSAVEGVLALHTLRDSETIAALASGVRRFELPDEFNYIRMFRELSAGRDRELAQAALKSLAEIYENRRQFVKATEVWKELIARVGSGPDRIYRNRLEQIVGAWGKFEPVMTQPAGGDGVTVDFRFRNGKSLSLVAHEINVERLLEDVKHVLQSNPPKLAPDEIDIENLGRRIVYRDEERYLGKQVAAWTENLEPGRDHFDRRITLRTPLKRAGAYLLTATIAGGNTSRVVLWVADTVIVQKPLKKGSLYFVADAVTGKPVPEATIELFGYREEPIEKRTLTDRAAGRFRNIVTQKMSLTTDGNGQAALETDIFSRSMLVATARSKDGRFAYLGFSPAWNIGGSAENYSARRAFIITDRPVYRPGQSVKFKVWVADARYDEEEVPPYANRTVTVQFQNPRGEVFNTQTLQSDGYGGVVGEVALPSDALLGPYLIEIRGNGLLGEMGTFRVEEYKKPEFEVTVDVPADPVELGETVKAIVSARYYFGAPVTKATVKYTVVRTSADSRWYPTEPWDWLYGSGYSWFGYEYSWYPSFARWGCPPPPPFWWLLQGEQKDPPEVVQTNEVEIGSDGKLEIAIDTKLAKELHGDTDHHYVINAEVTDGSRRLVSGSGQVMVSRQPFRVFAWVDRGYYRRGDTVKANFQARRPDGKPVSGEGVLRLFSVSYNEDGKANEERLEEWLLNTDGEGRANFQLTAARAGQFRLSYTVRDRSGHSVEGGYIFTVTGDGDDGRSFRFNAVEILPDKKEYRAGDTARVMLNTNFPDATVLLFIRPENGVYPTPEVIHLRGKSTIREILVTKGDMPNFFLEAVTVSGGRVHTEVRPIVVPPEERVFNVEVRPSFSEYKPGQEAKLHLRVTDTRGKPVIGSMVLSVYDQALEFISGGSNVPEIKAFFWKWQRRHAPIGENSLERESDNLVKPKERTLLSVGIFGNILGDSESGARRRKAVLREKQKVLTRSDMFSGSPFPSLTPPISELASEESTGGEALPRQVVQPSVRKELADLALWVGTLETDASGEGEVTLKMPENLTEWKVMAWAMGRGTRVGQGEARMNTKKDLLVRLQTPRFLIERDELVLSANIHNYLRSPKSVQAKLELDGELLEFEDVREQTVTIESNGEKRVNWRLKVLRNGEATVRVYALTDEESDAMEVKIPVHVHGMEKTESFNAVLRPTETKRSISFSIPRERRVDQSVLEIQYSPTLIGTMVDALPYLVSYPYGCTEQTLSRFLPTVMTQGVIKRMGLDLEAIRKKREALDAEDVRGGGGQVQRWRGEKPSPVFDEREVGAMARAGLDRLGVMQLSDGGWGWFSGEGEYPSAHLTALVVHGLQIAQRSRLPVNPDVLRRGLTWLRNYQATQVQKLKNASSQTIPWKGGVDNVDALVFMVLVDANETDREMLEFLYRDRRDLSVYGQAMYALALHTLGEHEQVALMRKQIEQFLVVDDENETAYLRLPVEDRWYWYGSEIETLSYYLKLLVRVAPKDELASRVVKYLVNNRKHATYWNSTRDTAVAIEALAEYLMANGEDRPELSVEVLLDGKKVKEVTVTRENLFTFNNRVLVSGTDLGDGRHTVEIRKKGSSRLYVNAYVRYFSLEDFLTRAGLEIKVNRRYYRLRRAQRRDLVQGAQGQAIEQEGEKYEREELANLAEVKSGELVEIELDIESKNDYEYLVFEDLKPAGFEPIEVRSGYNGNELGAYVEFRDARVVFFVQHLPRGRRSVSYRMRGEIPGKFSALPTRGYAMYAPELRANSDEMKILVSDREM